MKDCIKCSIKKSFSEFHKSNVCTDGHRGSCKVCTNKENKHRRSMVKKSIKDDGTLPLPSFERLSYLFLYDDGDLVRKVSLGNSRAGNVVGLNSNQRYKRCVIDSIHYLIIGT